MSALSKENYRQSFNRVLRTVKHNYRASLGSQAGPIIEKIDAAAEDCFERSVKRVTPHAPFKEVREHAKWCLIGVVRADVNAIYQERHQHKVQGLIDMLGTILVSQQTFVRRANSYLRRMHIPPKTSHNRPPQTTWQGAGIWVTNEQPESNPRQRVLVVTPHSHLLARFLYIVRDATYDVINHISKHELYGRTAESMQEVLKANPDATAEEIIIKAIETVELVLKDWYALVEQELKRILK